MLQKVIRGFFILFPTNTQPYSIQDPSRRGGGRGEGPEEEVSKKKKKKEVQIVAKSEGVIIPICHNTVRLVHQDTVPAF